MRAFVGTTKAIERKQAAIDKALGLPRCECGNAVRPNRGGRVAPCPGADESTGPADTECRYVTKTHRRPIPHPTDPDRAALFVDSVVESLSARDVDVGGRPERIDAADAVDLGPEWFPEDDAG